MRHIKNVSNLLKLSIWMEKLGRKMYFKLIYVKNVKAAFEEVVTMATA